MALEAVLVVTPHSSGHVPQNLLAAMLGEGRDDLEARQRLLRRIYLQGDPYTDDLFDVAGTTALHAWASRFVVDVNRPRDKGGPNGVVKLTDFDSQPFYPPGAEPDDANIEERLRRYWDPFHDAIRRLLRERSIELILGGHSMTGTGPSLGPDRGEARPAVTLMTGGDEDGEPRSGQPASQPPSLPPKLAREFRDLVGSALGPVLAAAQDEVAPVIALNRPWSADELSYKHGPPAGIPAFGLELNRLLFMNEETGEAMPGRLRALRAGLSDFVAAALAATRRLSARGRA